MQPVSAVLITFNEEINIEAALRSVSWADEIVVVDSGSTDTTLEICRRYTDRVLHRDWTGFVDQKNFACRQAGFDWIFSLDADERPTPALTEEIQDLRRRGFSRAGYRIPRVAWFMGRWIRHSDWYPDYQLRLFDRRRGSWKGGLVHESVAVEGEPGRLNGELEHFTYRSLSEYLRRLELYSTLAAEDCARRGKASGVLQLVGNPAAAFVKSYFMKRGFLDGIPGLMVGLMGAASVYFKYAKLYELRNQLRMPERE